MKEEGFVNGALNLVRSNGVTGRWLANQASFNLPDDALINPVVKAVVIFAIGVHNEVTMPNELDKLINEAVQAETVGEIKEIIEAVNQAIKLKIIS